MEESKTTSSPSASPELEPPARSHPPITLEAITAPERPEGEENNLFLAEKRDYDSERLQLELREREEDIAHRTKYSRRIFDLVRVWLVSVFGTVVLDGVGLVEIDSSVLVALIGGTTVSVVGLFAIVARYFFPKR